LLAAELLEDAMRDVEEIARICLDASLRIHRDLGPGLLESVYEAVLAAKLTKTDLLVERQKIVPLHYEGLYFQEGFRIDLLVERALVVEVKAVDQIATVHSRQLLTYLRLTGLSLGLVINFGAAMLRDGIKRVVNNHGVVPGGTI
jgi:iron complex transport system substrate-binding protein